jgi:hypothetical protein
MFERRFAMATVLAMFSGLLNTACSLPTNDLLVCETAASAEFPADLYQGPDCDCDSYFPMCKDATWRYEVTDLERNTEMEEKSWRVTGLARHLELMFDEGKYSLSKNLPSAWAYCRATADDVRHAWLTSDGAAVYWENSSWFEPTGSPAKHSYYVPRRVRLFTDAWTGAGHDTYLEYQVEDDENGNPKPEVTSYDANWNKRMIPEVVSSNPLFSGMVIRCEGSWPHEPPSADQDTAEADLDTGGTDEPTVGTTDTATFCFARGVGKIYEWKKGDSEELLVSAVIPGCDPWREH